jgi:hypothetical protein
MIVGGVMAFLAWPEESIDLELTRINNALRIVNRGDHPVTILRVTINDKTECSTDFNQTLGMGNAMGVANPDILNLTRLLQKQATTNCGQIIKATVVTNKGSRDYYFN